MITLTPLQQYIFNQIKAFIESDASVFILRGYAGTGKTTMIKIIADYIAKTQKVVLMQFMVMLLYAQIKQKISQIWI